MDKYTLVRVFLILLASATLWLLVSRYSNNQQKVQSEKFFDEVAKSIIPVVRAGGVESGKAADVQPSESLTNEDYKAVDFTGQALPNDCFPKDKLTAEDLLPKDAANSKWAQVNPAGQGDVKDQNFLQAGHHVGLNTTQGSMRNANLQIRSEPPNPQQNVGPWMQTTMAPDLMRRPLEIGEDC